MSEIGTLADMLRERGVDVRAARGCRTIHWRDGRGILWYAHDEGGRRIRLEMVTRVTAGQAMEVAGCR